MEQRDYNRLLYEKSVSEYTDFITELKSMTSDEIIEHSYEKVIKEDLVTLLENNDIDQDKAKSLYLKKHPLDYIYQEWLDKDCSHMEMLEDTINDSAERATKERKEKSKESR